MASFWISQWMAYFQSQLSPKKIPGLTLEFVDDAILGWSRFKHQRGRFWLEVTWDEFLWRHGWLFLFRWGLHDSISWHRVGSLRGEEWARVEAYLNRVACQSVGWVDPFGRFPPLFRDERVITCWSFRSSLLLQSMFSPFSRFSFFLFSIFFFVPVCVGVGVGVWVCVCGCVYVCLLFGLCIFGCHFLSMGFPSAFRRQLSISFLLWDGGDHKTEEVAINDQVC